MMTPDEQQDMERGKLTVPTKEQILLTGGTLLTTGVIDLAAHAGGTGVVVGLLASFVVARHSKDILDCGHTFIKALVPGSDAPRVVEVTEQVVERIAPSEPHQDQATLSKLKRLVGLKPRSGEVATEPLEAVRMPDVERWREWYGDDDIVPPSTLDTSLFTFSQVLESGFTPSASRIYLGTLLDGTQVFVAAKDLCHVALAGNTGGGKSSLMRMIMMQLCMVRAHVLLLNPHYMRFDREHNEDWTPFEPYLEKPPVACAEYANIAMYLKWMAKTLLPQRIKKCAEGKLLGKPYFIVIDELRAIVKNVEDAPEYLAKILSEGRKYGIFLMVAATDFLAKTVAGDEGGAIRKMYRTALYVGGDSTTAKTLLDMAPSLIPETDLGKGTVMLRCAATKKAMVARVPYVDNETLYRYLGPSTFVVPSDDEEDTEVENKARLRMRILEMKVARFADRDIADLLGMTEAEYWQTIRDLSLEQFATSSPTSQASSVPTSATTSERRSGLHLVEAANEVGRSGDEVAEVAEVATTTLSEREMQIAEMFFVQRMNPGAIARELSGGKGGDAFQKISLEVADAIRKYVEVQRGA